MGGREPAARHQPQGAPRAAPEPRRHAALGEDPRQEGLARLGLAEAVRRPGLERRAAPPVRGRMRARRRATRGAVRAGDGGPGDHGLRHARAAEALPARHRQRRGLVEPGLQRAGLGQRPEDVDHARAIRRVDLLPRAHEHRGQAADRHQLPADRHEEPRHHRQADRAARRRARGQRGVLRQRRGAGGEPDRRGEQGLDLRQAPARARAHQHRRRQPRQARGTTRAFATRSRCSRSTSSRSR